MASAGFSITLSSCCDLPPNYVLGLLNSRLLYWRLRRISNVFRGGWITCTKQYVETLPIRHVDPSNVAGRSRCDRIANLVEEVLRLHSEASDASTEHEMTALERQITAIDQQIDAIVYKLYGLTDDEIRIVEGEG